MVHLFFLCNCLIFAFSEMDAGRQQVVVRKSATARLKQQREMSAPVPKVVPSKATAKRKSNAKGDRPAKKAMGSSIGPDQRD